MLLYSRGALGVGTSPCWVAALSTYILAFVSFVFIDTVFKEVFQIFWVCYLAISLLSIKFRMISLVLHVSRLPEAQQRVGGCFLNLMPQMKTLYLAYCANHPSAVNVLTEHRYAPSDTLTFGERTPWGLLWVSLFWAHVT